MAMRITEALLRQSCVKGRRDSAAARGGGEENQRKTGEDTLSTGQGGKVFLQVRSHLVTVSVDNGSTFWVT